MTIKDFKPQKGINSLRIGESDDLVITESFSGISPDRVRPMHHGIILICTSGTAQFEYDGQTIQISKNDLFLLMARSVIEKFTSSDDFNCREVWFSRAEMWNMNMYAKSNLSDLVALKANPKVKLSGTDVKLFDAYFQQLCYHMRNSSELLYPDIVKSILSTFLLETLSVLRRGLSPLPTSKISKGMTPSKGGALHGKKLAERFMQLAEQSDGRIRRVDEYADMLNVTPKYLSKLLMQTMGRRPSDMVTFFTLKAIENRLRFTDMTMQQIANDLNFANASFFGKYVKEHLGMTPLEYRIKYHHNEE